MDKNKKSLLIVGSGGREHALAYKAAAEGYRVVMAPGSEAIAGDPAIAGRCYRDCSGQDQTRILAIAQSEGVEAVIVGPEQPLVEGLADRLRQAGVPTFGPGREAARLEGSKVFAKQFLQRHQIPTAKAVELQRGDDIEAALACFDHPPVVKADGLAAGKGVVVAESVEQARAAILDCLEHERFGAAGAKVLLEERLLGQEVSFFSISDGESALHLAACQDHKRIGEGDSGANTGGMGAYLPAPVCDPKVRARIISDIVEPTIAGLKAEGTPFIGVLFSGLMIDAQGQPKVIEFNVRFGDPEIQPLVWGSEGPLVEAMVQAAQGRLDPAAMKLSFVPSATVILASAGYPASSTKGVAIAGLDDDGQDSAPAQTKVFHAGTKSDGAGGWQSNGGRVLGVCARGDSLREALDRAYARMGEISMAGGQFRRDIGWRALD